MSQEASRPSKGEEPWTVKRLRDWTTQFLSKKGIEKPDVEAQILLAHALGWLYRQPYAKADDCLKALRQICANSGEDGPPICLHGPDRGTVSSSLLALRKPLSRSTYFHAQGSPDQTPYADLSHLLVQLTAPRPS